MILDMYITLIPVIFAGIANMIFCKYPIFLDLAYPMDAGIILADNQRLFGANKTWKGFIGMIVFGIVFQVLWGWLLTFFPTLEESHYLFPNYTNTWSFNIFLGFLLGFAYVLFELPNSFIKRRLAIPPGKPANNHLRSVFILIDQADSIIGCTLVIAYFVDLSLLEFALYILLGVFTHLAVNQLLFMLKLRRNRY